MLSTDRHCAFWGDRMVKNAEYRIFHIFLVLILFSQVPNVAAIEAPAEQWNRSFGIDGSAFILKTDSEGNQEWMEVFPNCTLYSVQQTSGNGYIAAGVKNGNAWLVKLASDKESTQYEDGKNNESESVNGTESENAENVEYGNTSDSFFDQIRYYIYDTFNGFFQWDYYT